MSSVSRVQLFQNTEYQVSTPDILWYNLQSNFFFFLNSLKKILSPKAITNDIYVLFLTKRENIGFLELIEHLEGIWTKRPLIESTPLK